MRDGLQAVSTRRASSCELYLAGWPVGGGIWPVPDPWNAQTEALGAFIRSQRKLARLSLRQLAELTSLSNPYLSQVERGRHQPSVRVLKLIADALNISAETLLIQVGLLDAQDPGAGGPAAEEVAAAIRADHRLTSEQRAALIAVYDSMLNADRGRDH